MTDGSTYRKHCDALLISVTEYRLFLVILLDCSPLFNVNLTTIRRRMVYLVLQPEAGLTQVI